MLRCVARGSGDLDEAFKELNDSTVQFMLIKFPVGSGSFRRNKYIYLHFIGQQCGAVKRSKFNVRLGEVLEKFKNPSAGLEVTSKDELNFSFVVSKVQKVFVSDSGTFNLAKLREEYSARLEEEKTAMVDEAEESPSSPTSPIRSRKLAKALGLSTPQIVKAIQEEVSPFNWAAFEATPSNPPTLFEAGSGGLFELLENLPPNKVLFGITRVAFGVGRFRRTKRIFFQWVGDNATALVKGRANMERQKFVEALGPSNLDMTIAGQEEASIPSILAKLDQVFVVDDIKLPPEQKKKHTLTQEEYVAALQEEQRAASDFYQDTEAAVASPEEFNVTETVQLIHQDVGGLLWGIFQFA